ncbi:MAG: hypothetical protein WC333_01745 [Dehalococcoidia bacterium]|jgi:hypothetical protein
MNNTKLNEEILTAYRGGGEMPSQRRLWYFTTNVKYANWFKRYASLGKGKLFKADISTDNLLDLRFVTKQLNYLDLHYILKNNGIRPPKFVIENIEAGYGGYKGNLWEFLKEDNELWDNISEKYDGVIFTETNPEARHTGKAETIIIDMIKHPVEYEEV